MEVTIHYVSVTSDCKPYIYYNNKEYMLYILQHSLSKGNVDGVCTCIENSITNSSCCEDYNGCIIADQGSLELFLRSLDVKISSLQIKWLILHSGAVKQVGSSRIRQ